MIAALSKVIGLQPQIPIESYVTAEENNTSITSIPFWPHRKTSSGEAEPILPRPSPPGSLRLQVNCAYSRVPDKHIKRTIQEYSYPEVAQVVMRYFNSSTFRKEWIDRRISLLNAWISPILILQGFHSRTQPREWYENPQQYIPKSRDVRVRYIDAGHFWRLRILMRLQRPSGTS